MRECWVYTFHHLRKQQRKVCYVETWKGYENFLDLLLGGLEFCECLYVIVEHTIVVKDVRLLLRRTYNSSEEKNSEKS